MPPKGSKRAKLPDTKDMNAVVAKGENARSSTIPRKRKANDDADITPSDLGEQRFDKEDEVAAAIRDEQFISDAMHLALSKDPERTLLKLMKSYSFDFPRVQELLSGNQLPISISRVKYQDVAQRVGVNPAEDGYDMPSFGMLYARLPNDTFHHIIEDVEMFAKQYGTLDKHRNEEARARYLSSFFNRIIAKFSGLLVNTPETLIEGTIAKKGRIEYQFSVFGGITVLFIEVKPRMGTHPEILDFIAQVIAESDACSLINFKNGFDIPVLGILCVAESFHFFQYTNKKVLQEFSANFAVGTFYDDSTTIEIEEPNFVRRNTNTREKVRKLRSVCEAFYYVFLKGYTRGLSAHWESSVKKGKKDREERESTVEWLEARNAATSAIDTAINAWDKFRGGDLEESERLATAADEFLTKSVHSSLFKQISVFPGLSEDMIRGA